jgi:hypothetical protein
MLRSFQQDKRGWGHDEAARAAGAMIQFIRPLCTMQRSSGLSGITSEDMN